jgi:Holliday junction DNA helicase RuvA
MIGRLRGELLEASGSTVVVDVGGVGYEVQIPESVFLQLPGVGFPVDLHIRQVFREDGVSLYGFSRAFQRRVFDLLTEVKGCGPKIALALIGQIGEDEVCGAILSGDGHALVRSSGVGPKLAERLIVELKEKVAEETMARRLEQALTPRAVAQAVDPVVEALIGLGYKRLEAEAAAREAGESSGAVEERLKIALRSLVR